MTSKQRTQYLALDVLRGFSEGLVKVQGLSPRTTAQAVRLEQAATRMFNAIGSFDSEGQANDVKRRFKAAKQTINEIAPAMVPTLDYCNAMLTVVDLILRTLKGTTIQKDWENLQAALETIYESMEKDLDEEASFERGDTLGVQLWAAITTLHKVEDDEPRDISFQFIEPGIHPTFPSAPTDMIGRLIRQQISSPKPAQGIVDM